MGAEESQAAADQIHLVSILDQANDQAQGSFVESVSRAEPPVRAMSNDIAAEVQPSSQSGNKGPEQTGTETLSVSQQGSAKEGVDHLGSCDLKIHLQIVNDPPQPSSAAACADHVGDAGGASDGSFGDRPGRPEGDRHRQHTSSAETATFVGRRRH